MDAESLLAALVRTQIVASAAILVVLLLRPLALRWCGAGTAYWLWIVVPLAAMAVLLPAREQVVTIPAAADIPVHRQPVEAERVVGVLREPAVTPPLVQPGTPRDQSGSTLLLTLWLLGAAAFFIRSIINTRRLSSGSSIGPALVGVLRPRLVLPQDFETRFNAEERALILAHEEMHRVSRHTLVNALVEVARCASWFNPLAHLAAGRFRADQELACDTAVVATNPRARRAYAEALLKAQVAGAYLPMGCVWTSSTAARLAERIARLSKQLPGRHRRFAGAASIVGIGIAASYAVWAQQPAKIITVQQPNPESTAVVSAATPAPKVPAAASAPTAAVPGASKPPASQAPVPTAQAPGAPSVANDSVNLRLAFAQETVFDDRAIVNGQPNPTYGTPVCRIVRDGALFFDDSGGAEPGSITDTLRKLAASCQPIKTPGASDALRRLNVVTGGASEPISAMLQSPTAMVNAAKAMKERLKDPEYRRQVLAQSRVITKDSYPGLARQLGLSESEEERLLDLLADNQVARIAENPFSGGSMDQQEFQESVRMIQEFNRREDESIRAMLGGKYGQWQTYQQKRRSPLLASIATAAVASMSRQLADAGKPALTTEQSRALTAALNAEAQRLDQENQRMLAANPADEAKREENKRRWLDAIAAYVDAEQFAVLRKTWEQ